MIFGGLMMVTEPAKPLAYRLGEAARMCGTSRDTLERLIGRGELKSYRLGTARYIPVAELEALIQRLLDREAE
jgi:excisionase family DNA binding protein